MFLAELNFKGFDIKSTLTRCLSSSNGNYVIFDNRPRVPNVDAFYGADSYQLPLASASGLIENKNRALAELQEINIQSLQLFS
jgi:hypothetical protein